MPLRLLLLALASALAALAQSNAVPSTPLTYFLGRGPATAFPTSLAVGPGGDIWVGGEAYGNVIPVVNAIKEEHSGGICSRFGPCADVFFARLRADGQGAVFSTYLGGEAGESLAGIAVDTQGNSYLTGASSSNSFPFDSPLPDDAPFSSRPFVVKISPSGAIVYAVELPAGLSPSAIGVDRQGAAYVAGTAFGPVEQVAGLGLDPGEADMLRSDDGGQTWQFRNRGLSNPGFSYEGNEMTAVKRGDGVRLYALGADSLYRSDDRGETWTRHTPPKDVEHPYVTDLAVGSTMPDRVVVAHSCGLSGSSDGGGTWTRLMPSGMASRCVARVAITPGQPERIYTGGYGNNEFPGAFAWLRRSDDGGQSWTDLPLPQVQIFSSVEDLAADPADSDIVYASFGSATGYSLFRSDDGGQSWHEIFEGSVRAPVIDAAATQNVFLVTRYFSREGRLVYRSSDRGETWISSVIPEPAGSDGGWLLNLAIGAEALFVTTNEGFLYQSADRGQSWTRAPGPPVAAYQVAADPVQPGTIYTLGNSRLEQGFLMKLGPDGSRTEYLSLLGGSNEDRVLGLAVDEEGRVYLMGTTASPDFPLTAEISLNRPGFNIDAFVTVVSPGGDHIEFSSWLGGSAHELPSRIALGAEGTVIVAGSTDSRDFPLENPVMDLPGRFHSHWIAALKPESSRIVFSGYLAPNDSFGPAPALAADANGFAYVGGQSGAIGDNGFVTEEYFLMRLDAAGNVVHLDPVPAQVLAAASPGRVVSAAVAGLGTLDRPWRLNETPSLVVALRDYEADETEAPRLQAVVNAADQLGHPLSPGTVVSIYGRNLGPAIPVAVEPIGGRYPSEVAGVRVLFGDRPAPLLFVSERQINVVTPGDLGAHPLASLRVERDGVVSNVFGLTTGSASPAIFSVDAGLGHVALALNADGTLNSPDNPAKPGSIATIFATGVGAFSPTLGDGEVAPLEPPFPAAPGITGVGFPFHQAQITYIGAAPGVVAGVAQINFVVPPEQSGESFVHLVTGEGNATYSVRFWVGL